MNDHSQSLEIAGRLRDSVQKLHDMVCDVAKARTVREHASDRRKNLLAKFMYKHSGGSISHSEMLARTDPDYLLESSSLEDQFLSGETVLSKLQAELCRYEGLRSLLSYSKQVFESLQG